MHTERDRVEVPDQGRWRRSRSFRVTAVAASVLIVLLLVSAFVVQPYAIPSSSMAPTLRVGDRVLVNKLAYRSGDRPERGDVVVFDGRGSFLRTDAADSGVLSGLLRAAGSALGLSDPPGTEYVKRVIGVGGDRVRCCDERGRLLVNGEPVTETYLFEGDEPSAVRFDIRVPEGRLWVMGDHRSASSDSRDHLGQPGGGTVPLDRVIGRVDWIAWPPDHWTTLGAGEARTARGCRSDQGGSGSGVWCHGASPGPKGRGDASQGGGGSPCGAAATDDNDGGTSLPHSPSGVGGTPMRSAAGERCGGRAREPGLIRTTPPRAGAHG